MVQVPATSEVSGLWRVVFSADSCAMDALRGLCRDHGRAPWAVRWTGNFHAFGHCWPHSKLEKAAPNLGHTCYGCVLNEYLVAQWSPRVHLRESRQLLELSRPIIICLSDCVCVPSLLLPSPTPQTHLTLGTLPQVHPSGAPLTSTPQNQPSETPLRTTPQNHRWEHSSAI